MKRIVAIDDCRLTLQITRDMLEGEGYEVTTATNSNEAFNAILHGDKPSLLLIDVTMPLIEGDAIVKALKGNSRTNDIPILYYSSKSAEELQSLVDVTGADGYLTKPISQNDLIRAVRSIVS